MLWTVVQWVGALAGIAALTIQAVGAWRSRRDPHDLKGTRAVLDTAYGHVLPIAQGPNGTPSLRMVDGDAWRTMVDLPRYSERLADPVLRRSLHDAGLAYHLAFALGTNLNGAQDTWPADLVDRQMAAARECMDSIESARRQLDSIERRKPAR
ncbi:hypothetical protein [Nocardioides okcheonensis]|uniref:hypothetical protein n=1 Tax=Nocardioides okcheonensis TaxID=2894081 RepID=UPI001E643361|nr:hypothetical protein [Nocardioides okcheonensis]UFN45690.1 hypothetical protein LN652_05625 [Nocardioides okcheonensis]